MIILVSEKELKWSKIQTGHCLCLKQALEAENIQYTVVDLEESFDFTDRIVINIGNHQYNTAKVLDALRERVKSCRYLISVIDDYNAGLTTQIRKAVIGKPNICLSHMFNLQAIMQTRKSWQWAQHYYHVNWNFASYRFLPLQKPFYDGLLYYGMYREDRENKFQTYLDTDLYPVHISASNRAHARFDFVAPLANPHNKFRQMPQNLQQFAASIYIEDNMNQKLWHCPANRFFECLGAGIAQFFDVDSVATFDRLQINVRDYTVSNAMDIRSRLKDAPEIAYEQRSLWKEAYQNKLVLELRGFLRWLQNVWKK